MSSDSLLFARIKFGLGKFMFFVSIMVMASLFYLANVNIKGFICFTFVALVLSFLPCSDFSASKKNYSFFKLAFSLVLPSLLAVTFYQRMQESNKIQNIASILNMRVELLLGIVSIVAVIVSLYSSLLIVCFLYEKYREEFLNIKKYILSFSNAKKSFFILFAFYLISFGAIMFADTNYADDMQRIADGYPGFNPFSRHVSDLLCRFIHTNSYLADISPLTQLIATIFITVSSFIIVVTFSKTEKISIWNLIAVLPLGVSPYFLTCLSYKYDSPYMALSILASVVPILFLNSKRSVYIITIILGIIITCSTYQAATGIFPILIIMISFLKWIDNEDYKKIIDLILKSIIGYIIGIFAYRILLMQSFEEYVDSSILPLKSLPSGVVNNIKTYFFNIISDYEIKWLICIVVVIFSFIILATLNCKKNKILTVCFAVLTVFVSLCLSFGVYIVLDNALFAARAMYGFGVFIAIIAVECTTYKSSQVSKVASLYLSFCMVVFCFLYGNAMQEQNRYVTFKMNILYEELKELPALENNETINIQADGNIGISPIIENLPQYNGVLKRMLSFSDKLYLYYYFGLENVNVVGPFGADENKNIDLTNKNLPIISDNIYYSIYGDDGNVLIKWK